MALVAAVAIGLNPYVGTFVLVALAAFTPRLSPGAAALPPGPWLLVALIVSGLAVPIDLVLCKFVRTAPRVRAVTHVVAPLAGAGTVALVLPSTLPLAVAALLAAGLAWIVAAMLTSAAARASRSPAWVGLGHVPVLMSAATLSACLVPLGAARTPLGLVPALLALAILLWVTAAGWRHARAAHVYAPFTAGYHTHNLATGR